MEINNRKLNEKLTHEALWQSVTTKTDMISQFVLPDSTRVCLNSGSNLQFPYAFSYENREVRLSGEAYFKVTVNKKSPFVIHADKLEITVLGTTLNVISHKDQSSEVVLISGKVSLAVNTQKGSVNYGELKPGQRAIFNNQTETIQFETVDVEQYTSWRNWANTENN
jgi:ferric-dicitrate binding protein FerR (iron transport regulator)